MYGRTKFDIQGSYMYIKRNHIKLAKFFWVKMTKNTLLKDIGLKNLKKKLE